MTDHDELDTNKDLRWYMQCGVYWAWRSSLLHCPICHWTVDSTDFSSLDRTKMFDFLRVAKKHWESHSDEEVTWWTMTRDELPKFPD